MLSSFCASGFLVREPHLGHTNAGVPVAHLVVSIVTDPNTKNENGYAHTEFAEISFFGNSSAVAMNYCRKGMQISFAGSLTRIDTYSREDGSIGATMKITGSQLQLPPKPQGQEQAAPAPAAERATPAPAVPTTKAKAKAKAADVEECAFGIG
jgi:single-stranded DNA-binding protein